MTELKTLKDIKANPYDSYWKESVKAEAVKWANYYCMNELNEFCKFHNITEKDLEDEEK